jgi:hypothetical protein
MDDRYNIDLNRSTTQTPKTIGGVWALLARLRLN